VSVLTSLSLSERFACGTPTLTGAFRQARNVFGANVDMFLVVQMCQYLVRLKSACKSWNLLSMLSMLCKLNVLESMLCKLNVQAECSRIRPRQTMALSKLQPPEHLKSERHVVQIVIERKKAEPILVKL
jgi:hypothetical protein